MLLVVYSNSVGHEAVRSDTLGNHVIANTSNTWQTRAGRARVFLRRYPSRNVSLVSNVYRSLEVAAIVQGWSLNVQEKNECFKGLLHYK
jgi:hypothetical protein